MSSSLPGLEPDCALFIKVLEILLTRLLGCFDVFLAIFVRSGQKRPPRPSGDGTD